MSSVNIHQQHVQPQGRREKIWQGIVSLAPLQKFFAWFFRAIAILAMFFLAVSSAYIAVQVVLPGMAPDGSILSNIVEITMNISIEAALIGCFEMARDAKKNGDDDQYTKMQRVGICFFIITIVTLGFKVFNIPTEFDKYLQMLRVIASVIYCITAHPDIKSMVTLDVQPVSLLAQITALEQTINQRLAANQNAIKSVTESIEKVAQSMPEMAQVQPLDHEKMAQEVAQIVAQTMPQNAIDYSQVAQAILPLLKDAKMPQSMPKPEPKISETKPVSEPKPTPKPVTSVPKTTKKLTPEDKLEAAYQKMVAEGKRISGRALADATKINRNIATDWLKANYPDAISATKNGTAKVAQNSGIESQEEMPRSSDTDASSDIDLSQYRAVPLPQKSGTSGEELEPVEVETDPELVAV